MEDYVKMTLAERPVEGISGEHTREEIGAVLNKYSIYKDRLELCQGTGRNDT